MVGGGGGGQDGCVRRIEVFVKIQKKMGGGGEVGLGVRVDVNEELKFLGKFTQKKFRGGGGGVGSRSRGGQVGGGRVGGGVRVDVNTMLGVGGDGGCEARIEGIVQY